MVSGHPSENEGGGGRESPAPRFAYTEKFNQVFPYYLSIGMTYEQYWDMDCELVRFYRKAAQIKQDLSNQNAWLQGAYFYEALVDAAPVLRAFAKKGTKPTPYRKEPFELFNRQDKEKQEKVQENHDNQAKAYMETFAMAINKKFEEKGGGVDG